VKGKKGKTKEEGVWRGAESQNNPKEKRVDKSERRLSDERGSDICKVRSKGAARRGKKKKEKCKKKVHATSFNAR